MKKLLLLGAALLGLCAVGQTARAGGDDSQDNSYQRPAPRHYYEGEVAEPRYCPPPPPVYYAPPLVFGYGRPYYHRRHFRPYGPYAYGYGRPYGYGYGYAPGIDIGIGF